MKSFPYNIPNTLSKEKQLVEAKIDLLIEAFSQLCKEEEERIRQEEKEILASRQFIYSIKPIDGEFAILHKVAITAIPGRDDNEQWSLPFKIINGVLLHGDSYQGRSWHAANKLIPQGLFSNNLEEINKDW